MAGRTVLPAFDIYYARSFCGMCREAHPRIPRICSVARRNDELVVHGTWHDRVNVSCGTVKLSMYRTFVQELYDAHRRMECVLTLLRLQIDAIRPHNEPAVYTFLSNAVNYMHNFPRLNHHVCEELIWKRLITRDHRSLELCSGLTSQHHTFQEQEAALLFSIRRAQAGESGAVAEIKRIGTAYCELHADHIKREELDALPMAVEQLGFDEWHTIIGEAKLVRDPFDMDDKLKGYEALYEYLVAVPEERTIN